MLAQAQLIILIYPYIIETSHDNNDTSEAIKDSNSSENDIENIDSDDIQTAEAKFENLYRSLKKTSSSSSSSDSEDEDNVEVLDRTQKINQDLKFDLEIKSQDDIEKGTKHALKNDMTIYVPSCFQNFGEVLDLIYYPSYAISRNFCLQ